MGGNWPTQQEVDMYVMARAQALGIDPDIAKKVRRGESGSGFVGDIVNGIPTSFGPFQFHFGGLVPGPNSAPGLGDEFLKATGLNARDPSTWKQQVDFALQTVKKTGWTPFHAAKDLGISIWQGIKNAAGGVAGALSYYFPIVGYTGNLRETYHTSGAVDLFAPLGTDVRNIVRGIVQSVGTTGPGGNSILIRGEDGRDYYYAHFQSPVKFSAGDFVDGGQIIGQVGTTGNAQGTDPHVHIGGGYGIQNGTGPSGGSGIGFDFQSFLEKILQLGGSGVEIVGAIGGAVGYLDPRNIRESIMAAVKGVTDSWYQAIINYTRDRAATIVLLGMGIFLTIVGAWKLIGGTQIVTTVGNAALTRGMGSVGSSAARQGIRAVK